MHLQFKQQTMLQNTRKDGFVSIIGRWIHNIGIWLGSDGRGINWLAIISIVCFIITNIAQVIALYLAKDDPEKLFECFSVLSFCGMGFLKLQSLRGNQQRWQCLLFSAFNLESQQLKPKDPYNLEYESDDENDPPFRKHIENYSKKFVSTSTLIYRVYLFTAIVYIISPFIEYGLWQIQGTELESYPHILPCWSPLDGITFVGYIITVLAEGIAAVYCVSVHIAFDLSVVGIMIFVHGQFILLHDYSEHIGGAGLKYDLTRKRDIRAHYRISKCHKIHVSLNNFVKELSCLTKDILGFYFIVATLTLCSVAVQFKSTELSATQLVSLLQYMCATLTQLFLFCNFGDAVINESSVGLGEGPFAASSWCLSSRVRRELALLGVGMSRRCRMLAGPFHLLDLPSFIQIVRTAYSYYAVIRPKSE